MLQFAPSRATKETGKTYGRLTALRRITKAQAQEEGLATIKWNPHYAHWLCQCSCGNLKVVSGPVLRRGYVQSCGCLKRESARAATQDRLEQLRKKAAAKLAIALMPGEEGK